MLKECPNCHELVGDPVTECFKCHYDFINHKIKSDEERSREREEREAVQNEKTRIADEKRLADEAKYIKKINYNKKLNDIKEQQIASNAKYEYRVARVYDNNDGSTSHQLESVLNKYAKEGWRVKQLFVNELGHNSSSTGYASVSRGTNSTIDECVIIFERCIKPEGMILSMED